MKIVLLLVILMPLNSLARDCAQDFALFVAFQTFEDDSNELISQEDPLKRCLEFTQRASEGRRYLLPEKEIAIAREDVQNYGKIVSEDLQFFFEGLEEEKMCLAYAEELALTKNDKLSFRDFIDNKIAYKSQREICDWYLGLGITRD